MVMAITLIVTIVMEMTLIKLRQIIMIICIDIGHSLKKDHTHFAASMSDFFQS